MDFCIRLHLPDPPAELILETAATEAYGEKPPIRVPLPFDAGEITTLLRALDLNAAPSLTREFSLAEAQWLWAQGLITEAPVAPGPLAYTGDHVHRRQLRDYIRRKLYESLFSPLETALTAHFSYLRGQRASRILHVHLEMRSDQVFLFQLPWELLHGDESLGGEIQVSRYIRYQRPLDPLPSAALLRVLVLHSEPTDLPALALRDESEIRQALRTASRGAAFRIEFITTASIRRLGDALRDRPNQPTVVHFAGHGNFGWCCERCHVLTTQVGPPRCVHCGHPWPARASPCGFLAFTREDNGASQWISAEELRETLKLGEVRLTVLNACKSALGRRGDDVFNGIAQRLMDTVPAVVATPFPLDNQGAHEFARCFYQGLGRGMSLVEALHEVRLRMRAAFPDEWFRPVLYLRSSQRDGGCLVSTMSAGAGLDEGPDECLDGPGGGHSVIPELPAYLVDFREQERLLHDLIARHRGPDDRGQPHPLRQRPLVVLLPGWTDDFTAGYLLDRLCYRLKDQLRRYDENYRSLDLARLGTPQRLDCTGAEAADLLEPKLLVGIREALFGTRPASQDPRRFVFTEPVLFWTHLELKTMKEPDPAAFLRRFCEFWGRWGDQNHLLLVCVFVSYLKRPCTLWGRATDLLRGSSRINKGCEASLRRLQPSTLASIAGSVLPTLGPVCKQDATDWAWQLKSQGLLKTARVHQQLQERIEALFADPGTPLVDGGLPIGELCKHLDGFLMHCQPSNPS